MADSIFSEQLRELGRRSVQSAPATPGFLGREIGPREQFEIDRGQLDPVEFRRKYGEKAYMDRLFGAPLDTSDALNKGVIRSKGSSGRPGQAIVRQILGSGIATAASMANVEDLPENLIAGGSNAAFDLLGIDAEIQTNPSRFAGDLAALSSGVREGFTANIQPSTEAVAQREKEIKLADSRELFDQSDKGIKDTLKRIGRDALIEGETLFENPNVAQGVVSEAIGSMIPSLAASTVVTQGATKAIAAAGLDPKQGIGNALRNTATAATIGGVEGMAAYNDAYSRIVEMGEEHLSKNSPRYREAREAGKSHEEAAKLVAHLGGQRAQLVQTGLATVAGYGVTKFEGNPFDNEVGRRLYTTLISQTAEEAFQSGTGAASANLGAQLGDENIEISEGVGGGIVQGALGGFGATSAIVSATSGPGILEKVLKDQVGKNIAYFAEQAAERKRQQLDDASPVGEKATTDNIKTVNQFISEAENVLKFGQTEPGFIEDEQALPTWLLDTTDNLFTEETARLQEDVVEGDRLSTFRRIAKKLIDGKYQNAEQAEAAAQYVNSERVRLEEAMAPILEKENPTQTETTIGEVLAQITSNRVFSDGPRAATEVLNNGTVKGPVRQGELALNPVGLDPERLDDETVASFPEDVQKMAAVVKAIDGPNSGVLPGYKVANRARSAKQNNRGQVSEEISLRNKYASYGVIPSFNELVSLALRGAVRAGREDGNTTVTNSAKQAVDAKDSMKRLRDLITNQTNKYNAAAASYERLINEPGADGFVEYEALNPKRGDFLRPSSKVKGETEANTGRIYANPRSKNSMDTWRQVREDANLGIRAYNAILEQFPGVYEGERIAELPPLPGETDASTSQETTQQPVPETVQETPEAVAADTGGSGIADTDLGVLGPNQLSFDALFNGGDRTTLTQALQYLDRLQSLGPLQKSLVQLIRASAFNNSSPNTVIRKIGKGEKKPRPTSRGWWDPVAREIVMVEPMVSELLHEMIHAATLETLAQAINVAYGSPTSRPLSDAEQAAVNLVEMMNDFIQFEPSSDRMNEVQGYIRGILNNNGTAGVAMAVNEFMAYGLTERAIQNELKSRYFKEPSWAGQIIAAIKRFFGLGKNETMLDKLEFETHVLAQDYQAAYVAPPQTEKVESNVEEGPSEETATPTPEGETQTETAPEQQTEAEPAPVREPEPVEEATETVGETSTAEAVEGEPSQEVAEAAPGPAQQVSEIPSTSETTDAGASETTAAEGISATSETEPGTSSAPITPTPTGTQLTEEQVQLNEIPVGDNLLGNDGNAYLKDLMELRPLMGYGDTVAGMVNQLAADLDYNMDPAMEEATLSYEPTVQAMLDRMNQRLKELGQRKFFGKPLLEAVRTFQEGGEFNPILAREGRITALVDGQSVLDGDPVYDEHLMKLALYAAIDFIMNNQGSGGIYKTEDIADVLGIPAELAGQVTDDMRKIVNFGRPASQMKDQLANHIAHFWGASRNTGKSRSQVDGVFEAVADEIFDMLQDEGNKQGLEADPETFWVQKQAMDITFEEKVDGKTVEQQRSYTAFRFGKKGGNLGPAKTIFRDIFARKDTDAHQYSLGEKIKGVAETLQRDRNIKIPEIKREAMRKKQDTAFRQSRIMTDLFNWLQPEDGSGNWLAEMLGYVQAAEDESRFYNSYDREAIKGKNNSIRYSINGVAEQMRRIQAYAEKNGIDPFEVETYYREEISVNGRYFKQGFNPQANKLARELFTPAVSLLDLQNSSDMDFFYAAVAQAMDEIKIENLGISESANWGRDAVQNKFAPAIEAIRNRDAEALRDFFLRDDVENTARLLKALAAVVQVQDAIAAGSTFTEIDLMAEIDGKTHGPIAGAIQMNTDDFSELSLQTYRRGGFFIGSRFDNASRDMTYSEWKENEDNSVDFYEITGQSQTNELVGWKQALHNKMLTHSKNHPRNIAMGSEALSRILELMNELGEVRFRPTRINPETGQRENFVLEIKRKGTKSPITQNLYGAGLESIAAGITNALFKMVYSEISEAVENGNGERIKRLAEMIDGLADINIDAGKDQKFWAFQQKLTKGTLTQAINNRSQGASKWREGMERFQFTSEAFKRITSAIRYTYMPSFEMALDGIVGESVRRNNKTMVKATNVQTNIYLMLLRKALNEETAKQREEGTIESWEELSQDDYNRILAEYNKYAPVFDTGSSVFDISSTDRESSDDVAAARARGLQAGFPDGITIETFNNRSETLSGSSSASTRQAAGTAGVRVIPYNIIGNSDVDMITQVYNDERMGYDTLDVHDGIEVPITRMREVSQIMNEAIANSWQKNTIKPIVQSIDDLLELETEARKSGLDFMMKNDEGELVDMFQYLKMQRYFLAQDSRIRDARIAAIDTVQYTVDGAPGAEAPFVKSDGARFTNERDLANHLRNEVNEYLATGTDIAPIDQDQNPFAKEDNAEFRRALTKRSFRGMKGIQEFLDIMDPYLEDAGLRQTLEGLIRSKGFRDIVQAGLEISLARKPSADGPNAVYNAYQRKLTINVLDPSSAVHELVHATTFYQLSEHYRDPFGNEERGAAVQRLESLLDDFMRRDYDATAQRAQWMMKELLLQMAVEGKAPAIIMNEFMAHMLTNNELIAQGKSKLARDPLSQMRNLGRAVLRAMRKLLGFTSDKVFDHILFNTLVIANEGVTQSQIDATKRAETLQSASNIGGRDTRILRIQNRLGRQVSAFLQSRNRGDDRAAAGAASARRAADYAANEAMGFQAQARMEAAGFTFTPQEAMLFRTLQAVFSTDMKIDKLARIEIGRIFEALSTRISPTMFEKYLDGDRNAPDFQERANNMTRAVLGLPFTDVETLAEYNPEVGSDNLTNTLGAFLALAQTSPIMRAVLDDIDLSSLDLQTDLDRGSVDQMLEGIMGRAIGRINKRVLEDPGSQNDSIATALDTLTEQLLTIEAEQASEFERYTSNFMNRLNTKGAQIIEGVGDAITDTSRAVTAEIEADPEPSTLSDLLGQTVTNLGDLLNRNRAEIRADQLTRLLNVRGASRTVRNLIGEIRSITGDTAKIFHMVKRAKQTISSIRQTFVEGAPKILRKKFSDNFNNKQEGETNKEFTARMRRNEAAMMRAMNDTDIGILSETIGSDPNAALRFFGNHEGAQLDRENMIMNAKGELARAIKRLDLSQNTERAVIAAWSAKAEQLGNYMVNKKAGKNLLTSAYSIIGLGNEAGLSLTQTQFVELQKAIIETKRKGRLRDAKDEGLTDILRWIDALTSLQAIDQLPQDVHDTMAELVNSEPEALRFAISFAQDLRNLENDKTDDPRARINGIKGHTSNHARRKFKVIVAPKSDEVKLREHGYIRMRDYNSIETKVNPNMRGQAYYFSGHQKLSTYNQGAMQTVQDTFFGIDPQTTMIIGPEATGRLITGDAAKLLNERLKKSKEDFPDDLIPRFDSDNTLIGFQEALGVDMIERLERSDNFTEALGQWAGRIHEEGMAGGLNEALIDAVHEQYVIDVERGRGDEYAAFGFEMNEDGDMVLTEELQEDPIWAESFRLMPKAARDYAKQKFSGHLRIRRDMINNVLGFRQASVSDIYTGKSRWNDDTRKVMKDIFLATPFMGPDMYKVLTVAEESLQTIVAEVKHVIVVKSGVVLAANTLSNIAQLAMREVPLSYMGKRTKSKFAEVQQYKKNEELKVQLRIEKLAETSTLKKEQIQKRIDAIEESERRMSIWPLIEANQFTTISEGLTDLDKSLMDNRFMDWIEKKAAELPGPLSTVARYAIVSKDTALYQGLARAVQYSDFVAKGVYYDFLTEERGISHEEAITKIDQEFINYDLNDSRNRSYLESIGLTWFMNFKLRSIKIALDMMRTNPAGVLIGAGLGGLFGLSVGSPVFDNFVGTTADGRLGYSLGPGMIEAGWNLNPWVNITS